MSDDKDTQNKTPLHSEKSTMQEPQEEFISDEPRPSRDVSEYRKEEDEAGE